MDPPGSGEGGGPPPTHAQAERAAQHDWGVGRSLESGEVVTANDGNNHKAKGDDELADSSDEDAAGDTEDQVAQAPASTAPAAEKEAEEETTVAEEQQCRICRSGDDDEVLFRPCKCSGSIGYCHQDCLIEWLSHSRKKYCELCGHPFTFRKRYKSTLPKGLDIRWTPPFRLPSWLLPQGQTENPPTLAFRLPLPAYLYVRRMALQALSWVFTGFRGIAVLVTWLVLLPLVNIQVWRTYFWASDIIISAWQSALHQPVVPAAHQNVTAALNASSASPVTLVDFLASANHTNWSQPVPANSNATLTTQIAVPLRSAFAPVFRSIYIYCADPPISPATPLYAGIVNANATALKTPIRTFQYYLAGKRYHVDVTKFCALVEEGDDVLRRIAKRRPNFDPFSFKLARLLVQTTKSTAHTARACSAAGPNVCFKALWQWVKRWTIASSSDLVEGQVLTCGIIVVFVGIFLLREWVHQNLPQVVERLAAQVQAEEEEGARLQNEVVELQRQGEQLRRQADELQRQADEQERVMAELLRERDELLRRRRLLEAGEEHRQANGPEEGQSAAQSQVESPEPARNSQAPETGAQAPNGSPASDEGEQRRLGVSDAEDKRTETTSLTAEEQVPRIPDQPSTPRIDRPTLRQAHSRATPGTPAIIQSYRRGEGLAAQYDELDARALDDSLTASTSHQTLDEVPTERNGDEVENRSSQAEDENNAVPLAEKNGAQAASTSAREDPSPMPAQNGHIQEEGDDVGEGVNTAPLDDIDHAAPASDGEEDHPNEAEDEDDDDDDEDDEDDDEEDEEDEDVFDAAEHLPDEEAGPVRIDPVEGAAADLNDGNGEPGWEDAEQMGALDEELDGMLEAIGMRGPILGLLQNACLMVVLCSIALMLFVAVPYVAGRTFGFGTPLIQLAAYPVKLVRMVTDPTFDTLIEWVDRFVLRPTLSMVSRLPVPVRSLRPAVEKVASPPRPSSTASGSKIISFLPPRWAAYADYDKALAAAELGLDRLYDFGVYLNAKTRGVTVSDRVLCVMLGHSYWLGAIMLDAYFGVFRKSQQLQWLRSFVEMQRLIIKVLLFMIIELLIFPIGCGLVLDICLAPLLEPVSFGMRWQEASDHPLTFFFVRWVSGTLYMFGFAQWVGSTRQLLRKGVLSWIRDPNDPTFSPVREILERRTLAQLKKILSSAIMYGCLLLLCVGLNLWFVRQVWPGVLPLRWRPFKPLSSVPFDLLGLYYGMPLWVRILKPGSLMRRLSRRWWSRVARALRMSSFLLGKDAPLEQGHVEYSSWAAWVLRRGPRRGADEGHARLAQMKRKLGLPSEQPSAASPLLEGPGWRFVESGAWARVPGDDSPAPNSRIFIMVDRSGIPIDQEQQEALAEQERIIDKLSNKPRYEVVYLPPRFRLRVYMVLFMLWLSVSIGIQVSVAAPLLAGRAMIKVFTPNEQHDFYAWAIGCPLLSIPMSSLYRLWNHRRRARRRERERERDPAAAGAGAGAAHGPHDYVYTVQGVARHAAVLAYFGVTLGVVIPFLIGMTVRVYLIEPWLDVSQLAKPVPVFQTWAMGLMEQVLFVRLLALQDDGWARALTASVEQMVRDGIGRNVRPWRTTKRVILPVLGALALLLMAPPLQVGINFALRPGPPLTPTLQQTAVRAAYKWFSLGIAYVLSSHYAIIAWLTNIFAPAFFRTAKVLRMIVVRIDEWTMALKDELFLESTELTNYVPAGEDDEHGNLAAGAAGAGPGRRVGRGGRAGGIVGVEDEDGLGAIGLLPDRFL